MALLSLAIRLSGWGSCLFGLSSHAEVLPLRTVVQHFNLANGRRQDLLQFCRKKPSHPWYSRMDEADQGIKKDTLHGRFEEWRDETRRSRQVTRTQIPT